MFSWQWPLQCWLETLITRSGGRWSTLIALPHDERAPRMAWMEERRRQKDRRHLSQLRVVLYVGSTWLPRGLPDVCRSMRRLVRGHQWKPWQGGQKKSVQFHVFSAHNLWLRHWIGDWRGHEGWKPGRQSRFSRIGFPIVHWRQCQGEYHPECWRMLRWGTLLLLVAGVAQCIHYCRPQLAGWR